MGFTDYQKYRRVSVAVIAAIICAGLQAASAEPAGDADTADVQIDAGPLGDTLRTISLRTGTPIIFSEDLVAGRTAPALAGRYAGGAAVRAALAGSGLKVTQGRGGVLRIEAPASAPEPDVVSRTIPDGLSDEDKVRGDEEADLRIDRVTVTGTRLRGIAPESSPLQVFTRDDILGSGARRRPCRNAA